MTLLESYVFDNFCWHMIKLFVFDLSTLFGRIQTDYSTKDEVNMKQIFGIAFHTTKLVHV